MNKKIDLLFGLLYFGLILFGYVSTFFTPITDLLFGNASIYIFYHDYLIIAAKNIFRLLIYIIGIIVMYFIYKKINKETKDAQEKTSLTTKKKFILYIITLSCLTIVSILAGWQVKILTDLGDKYNIYNVYVKLSEIAAFSAEIYLLCLMLFHFDKFTSSNFKKYEYFSFASILLLLTYSIYSLIMDFTIYQIVFIPFTLALGFIYPYTNRKVSITYLITLLVFLF